MGELEAGAIANPDEKRMVGHYWLRDSNSRPPRSCGRTSTTRNARIKQFAAEVHAGKVAPDKGGTFKHVLLVGIGGSALGPAIYHRRAWARANDPLDIYFLDNTDPDGIDRVLRPDRRSPRPHADRRDLQIRRHEGDPQRHAGSRRRAIEKAGLDLRKHAVAVTGVGSELDKYAEKNGWLTRFPMCDWVGGRTSVMSAVGLVPRGAARFRHRAISRGRRGDGREDARAGDGRKMPPCCSR